MYVNKGANKVIILVYVASVAVTAILFVVTIALAANAVKKKNNYSVCKGTITGFHENSSEAVLGEYEASSVAPVVQYTVDGKTYEFIGKYYSTSMKVGGQVDVLYNPADVSIATIKAGVNFAPIITGSLTVVFFIISILFFVLRKKGIV